MSDSLLKISLNPDLDKLSGYISKPIIARYQKTGVYLESTMTEAYYARIYNNLIKIFEKNNLLEHTDELLYIILMEDEILSDSMLDAEMNYQDIQNAIEVSNFLLAFKRAENNQYFQIGIKENIGTTYKPKTESAYVRNHEISKWMCQTIYDAIEAKKFPLGIFGETFLASAFNNNISKSALILEENLLKTANLKNKKPSVLRKKMLVTFCNYLRNYLEVHTHLKIPIGVSLTDAHSNLFFDVLETIGYLNRDAIESEPKDYIASMFQHNS